MLGGPIALRRLLSVLPLNSLGARISEATGLLPGTFSVHAVVRSADERGYAPPTPVILPQRPPPSLRVLFTEDQLTFTCTDDGSVCIDRLAAECPHLVLSDIGVREGSASLFVIPVDCRARLPAVDQFRAESEVTSRSSMSRPWPSCAWGSISCAEASHLPHDAVSPCAAPIMFDAGARNTIPHAFRDTRRSMTKSELQLVHTHPKGIVCHSADDLKANVPPSARHQGREQPLCGHSTFHPALLDIRLQVVKAAAASSAAAAAEAARRLEQLRARRDER